MAWTDLILVAVLVAGVVIAMRARAGRPVLGRPRCAACRHALTGLEMEGDARCPECGADLTGRDAVLFGRVAPQRWRFRIGILLVLGAVLVIGARTAQRHTNVEWAHLRPTSWVLRDLERPDRWLAAWHELDRRYDAGRLDDEDIAVAVDDVIDVLDQGNLALRTRSKLPAAKLLVKVLADDRIDEQQLTRLIVASVESRLAVDLASPARRNAWASFNVAFPLSTVLGDQRLIHLRAVRDAGGNELPLGPDTAGLGYGPPDDSREGLTAGGDTWLSGRVRAKLPAGEHELTFELDLGAVAEGVVPPRRPGPPEHWPSTRHRWTTTRTARIEVVDAQPGDARFDVRAARRWPDDPMRRLVQIGGWQIVRKSGVEHVELDIRISAHQDLTLAFDVILRFDGQERKFGACTVVAGATRLRGGRAVGVTAIRSALPDDLSTVDVILRSNPTLVERTRGDEGVWDGELVFEGIPMTKPPGPGSRTSRLGE